MTTGATTLCLLATVFLTLHAAAYNGCNVTNSVTGNETVNLQLLANFGNVTVRIDDADAPEQAQVSFCTPQNVTALNGANCGPAFLAFVGESCGSPATILFDVVASNVTAIDNRTSSIEYSSSTGTQRAVVVLQCQLGFAGLESTANVTVVGGVYTFHFLSELVCAGYVPEPAPADKMLSKGAIVGIIIGIVALVVIAAALFQWRAKGGNDDGGYQRI